MSKRKGVSAEEKRNRMLQLFYEKKDFFQLKELEKIAPKEKGIIAQSVKEVVQSLVDDNLVDTDKIGTSVYFWAFPSKAKHSKKRKYEDVSDKLDQSVKKLKLVKDKINEAKIGREDTSERLGILEEIETLKKQKEIILQDLQKFKDFDPEVLQKMKDEIKVAQEATNRWTDNIFALRSWSKNKFNIESEALDKQFGIPADFDYIDVV
uniref:Meiotic nuclear division protein 1 homolog n=1 Tax=Clastoptera arizonana TaxID=38151 RepID=A0A1B6EH26_9HEMI